MGWYCTHYTHALHVHMCTNTSQIVNSIARLVYIVLILKHSSTCAAAIYGDSLVKTLTDDAQSFIKVIHSLQYVHCCTRALAAKYGLLHVVMDCLVYA